MGQVEREQVGRLAAVRVGGGVTWRPEAAVLLVGNDQIPDIFEGKASKICRFAECGVLGKERHQGWFSRFLTRAPG